jgi:serpin B
MRKLLAVLLSTTSLWAVGHSFAWKSHQILTAREVSQVYSPYGCRQLLKLFYETGEPGSNIALQQLCDFSQQEPVLASRSWKSAESIFLDRNLQKKKTFARPVTPIDFSSPQAAAEINAWVASHTEKQIRDLVSPRDLNSETVLVGLNAIYLKAKWSTPFDPNRTQSQDWFPRGQVEMMHTTCQAGLWSNDEFALLELPLGDGQLVFDCLLPERVDGLSALRTKVTPEKLAEYFERVGQGVRSVEVALPRLKLQTHHDLLTQLSLPRSLDMSRLLSGPTQLSALFQLVRLDLDEVGVQASAASVGVVSRSMPERFVADHPFFFWIRDREQQEILFSGQFLGPP